MGHRVAVMGLATAERLMAESPTLPVDRQSTTGQGWSSADCGTRSAIADAGSLLGVDPFPEFVGRSVFDRAVSRG